MLPVYIRQQKPIGQLVREMAKLLPRVEITLRSFYIFNSTLGQKEGEEHKKILYYHPSDIELNTKIKDVGLSEAIITFTGTFTSEDDCKALHTKKTTQLFYQPEPGYWFVMVLNVPKEFKLKDGIEVADYRGAEVSDRIYQAVLRQFYQIYRFHHGLLQGKLTANPLTEVAEEQRQLLTAELQKFYNGNSVSFKDLDQCDVMDMLHSIQYLALDKGLFLRAHNFSTLCETYPNVKECIMLYNEQVVCGGNLSANDLYSLHAHILAASDADDIYCYGAFVRKGSGQGVASPSRVFLDVETHCEPHYLIIYRALNITLCLFVDGMEQTNQSTESDVRLIMRFSSPAAKQCAPQPEFYEELHALMGPQLTSLAHDISTEVSKLSMATATSSSTPDCTLNDNSPKYLFINEQSLKHHTNICRHAKSTQKSIPRYVMDIIADLANPINSVNASATAASATEELQVKTTNDYWVVKRRCNWRQYYVILCKSKATLLDVTQEAKRIFEQELTDDVFFDK